MIVGGTNNPKNSNRKLLVLPRYNPEAPIMNNPILNILNKVLSKQLFFLLYKNRKGSINVIKK